MDPVGQVILENIRTSKFRNSKDQYFNKAIIAGGFVRDHIMGGQFKDVDIFIPKEYNNDDYINAFFESDHGLDFVTIKNDNSDYPDDVVSLVLDAKYKDSIPVQLMFVKDCDGDNFPEQLMETFDYNINKCYYNGDDLVVTKEAERDIQRNVATLTRCRGVSEFPKLLERYNRWKIKYPNLRFETNLQIMSQEDLRRRENLIEQRYRNRIKELERILARKDDLAASTGLRESPGAGGQHYKYTAGAPLWVTKTHGEAWG